MSAIVPEYLLTSLPSPQTGVVETLNVPQSSITTLSLPASGLTASVLVTVPRASVKTPSSEPVFSMSTVPSLVSPGRMPEAVRIAASARLLDIVSVPVLNVLAGLAEEAVKSAPDATVTPTAVVTVASTARVRRGCRTRWARRDMILLGDCGRQLFAAAICFGGTQTSLKSGNAPTHSGADPIWV